MYLTIQQITCQTTHKYILKLTPLQWHLLYIEANPAATHCYIRRGNLSSEYLIITDQGQQKVISSHTYL